MYPQEKRKGNEESAAPYTLQGDCNSATEPTSYAKESLCLMPENAVDVYRWDSGRKKPLLRDC